MTIDDEEFREIEREHLGLLTSYGKHFLGVLIGSITLLEPDINDEIELSDDKRKEIFQILKDSANKYSELIDWSIRERQRYIDEAQDNNHDE